MTGRDGQSAGVTGSAAGAQGSAAVVRRHLAAVEAGDVAAMAADYAEDATIERPGQVLRGRVAIAAYFAEVPARLAGGAVHAGDVREEAGGDVVFSWRIVGGPAHGSSGTDRCTVARGMISRQVVSLDAEDF